MIPLVRENLNEIARLCRRYGVEYLDVFGSAVNGSFNDGESDVDFLVEFLDYGPGVGDRFLNLADDLEALLGRSVDLVTDRSIKNRFFRRSVDRMREPVFGERRRIKAS
jgi:predicted nucleotidyltransferase